MGDITTQRLNKVVPTLLRAQTALLTRFFPTVDVSEEAEIKFDIENGKRRLAPFVAPFIAGKVVESLGKKTATFIPAYIKDKRVFKPKEATRRAAGERIGGDLTMQQRRMQHLNKELSDQQDMLTRRQEVMASEALRTGKLTVEGEGYDAVEVDFQRNPDHTIVLAPGSKWGETGVSPVEDLEEWSETMLQNGGGVTVDVVLGTKSFGYLKADPKFKDAIDKTLGQEDKVIIGTMAKLGLKWKGQIDDVNIFVYSDWYVDPKTGTEERIWPENDVALIGQVDGVRHYGAIEDEEALKAMEYFTKTWVEHDPSVRMLLMQSAPLTVPYRPNSTLCATVAG